MANWIEYTSSEWRGLNMRSLGVDQAYITLISNLGQKVWLYTLSDECYKCPFSKLRSIEAETTDTIKIDSARPWSFKVFDKDVGKYAFNDSSSICKFSSNLDEFGVYNLSIFDNKTCNFITDNGGVNIYLSMLTVFLIYFIGICLWHFSKKLWIKYSSSNEDGISTENSHPVKKRMKSLDAFRGMAIVLMIFVNGGGGHYWWIEHAPWNGLHLADIVFPSFLWIMGVCIPISVKSQLTRGVSKPVICRRIFWRSVKLFTIGLCLNSISGPNLADLRVMGVLQRFGIAYLICGIGHTIFSQGAEYIVPQSNYQKTFSDIILMKAEFMLITSIIIINMAIIFGVPVPDCPRGYLGPGGKYNNASDINCIGGSIGYLDKIILGDRHIYQHATAKYIYDSSAFDPEGLFGCLPTIIQVFFGVLCGVTIISFPEWKDRVKRWIGWGIAFGLLAGILCLFSTEEGWIPVNKNLWSLSFVFATSSIAFILLTILYLLIDVLSVWSGYPFVECGMNSIILYVGHTIMHKMLPWHWRIGVMNTHFMLLLECSWNTGIWIIIALYLHSINYFYSV